ncbi:pathogenesis-related protein 1A-like [Wolffia australiana]
MAAPHLLLVLLACVAVFGNIRGTQAQNITQEFLNAHNTARSTIPVGPMVWNVTVAAYAQDYADKNIVNCTMVHSKGPYGENLHLGSGKEWTPTEAVQRWVDERQYYNYTTNTCAAGKACGHYTQSTSPKVFVG